MTSFPPLFSLPERVQDVLLSHVATGKGGIQSLLKLRQVCSTTKSWVDRFPNPQMELIFSKAKIHLTTNEYKLKEFLESPPPYAVTTLCLSLDTELWDAKNQCMVVPPEEVWNCFFDFWTSRLKALEVTKNGINTYPEIYRGYRPIILAMLQFPNLRKFKTEVKFKWNRWMTFPSSLYEVNELSMCFEVPDGDNQTKKEVLSHLARNSNLKKFDAWAQSATELDCIRNFIDARKDDTLLELSIKFRIPQYCTHTDSFVEFARSVVATKSEIRLTPERCGNHRSVESAWNILGEKLGGEFFKRIVAIQFWTPSNEGSLRLLRSLPELSELSLSTKLAHLKKLTFPPKLAKLHLSKGFPSPQRFPLTLTSLYLSDIKCGVADLLSSLATLSSRCPSLEELGIFWTHEDSAGIPNSKEESWTANDVLRFSKLRSLGFHGFITLEAAADAREVLLKGFRVGYIQLENLSLDFTVEDDKRSLPVLNAETLKRMCEGRLRSSIIRVNVADEVATPDGMKQLWTLRKLVSANRKRREKKEGRGEWQRRWH